MSAPTVQLTWMILKKDTKILLGYKKVRFGKGKLNGIGGKINHGETIEHAAIREMLEESCVKVTKLEKVATITFNDLVYNGVKGTNIMHCFIGTEWEGEPAETEEMIPEWIEIDQIPYKKMWVDDQYWLPQVLAGQKLEATFRFDENYQIISKKVKILSRTSS